MKTYAHKLKLVEEQMREQSAIRAELIRKVAEKRRELEQKYKGSGAAAR